ncbi:MAG: HAD family phosphatase [Polyangiaceae bacterium]|nr:HAD family phosphatase [Polyangiaceae bacterium]
MTPAAVLFDMDGLLLDSEPLWAEVLDAFCAARGGRYSDEDAAACLGRGIDRCVTYLVERYGFAGEHRALVEEIDERFRERAHEAPPCPHAAEIVEAAKARAKIALGSSTARPLVEAALGPRGWLERFDAVVTGSDVAHKKPAPDIFLLCAARLGVPIDRCVVLEDSRAGCEAGRAAGARVIAVGPEAARLATIADDAVADLAVAARLLGLR